MSELSVGTLSGLAANGYVIDVASGSQLTQPGMILQVVKSDYTSEATTTSTSFEDVPGFSISITPKKSDSLILVTANFQAGMTVTGATTNQHGGWQITDSSDAPLTGAELGQWGFYAMSDSAWDGYQPITLMSYDSPATLSEITYKLRFKSSSSVTAKTRGGFFTGLMLAMEVAA